jgi:hypothetical protein
VSGVGEGDASVLKSLPFNTSKVRSDVGQRCPTMLASLKANTPHPQYPTPHTPHPNMNNSNLNEDHSESFEQGEILSAIRQPALVQPQTQPEQLPKPTSAPKTAPFNPLDMASLAGLAPTDSTNLGNSMAITATEQAENIAESKTKLPIYKQSFFKLVMVGGGFLLAGLLLKSIVWPDIKPEIVAAPTPSPSPSTKPTEDFRPDPRFGVVNSKLAMGDSQRQVIDAAVAQQKASADKTAADKGATAPPVNVATPSPSPSSSIATNPPPTDSNPQIVKNNSPQADPVYQAPPPVTMSPAPTPVAKTLVATKPTPTSTPAPVRTVVQVREKPTRIAAVTRSQPILQPLAKPAPSANVRATNAPRATPVTWEVANNNAVGVWGKTGATANGSPAVATIATSPTNNPPASSYRSARNTGSAAVGQQIKSKLVIPYQAVTTAPSQPIFIALSTAVLDTQGKTLLPAGTQIMCEVAALDNGMLQVSSAKAAIDGQLIDLPKQAIILQDASKQPLVAQVKSFGQGEVFNRDLIGFAGGALSAIGKNMTQSQTQTVATTGGIIQTSNSQQNILGAVLDGGFSPLVTQWMERNKQATTQINSASKIYFLPTGTDVNLIIAQPFSL